MFSFEFALQRSEPVDADSVREALLRVAARDEFHATDDGLWKWIGARLEKLIGWLSDFFGISAGTAGRVVQIGLYTLLAVTALALLFLIARALTRAFTRPSAGELDLPTASSASRAAALRAQARAAELRGDRVGALRLYFGALVVGLSERGDLEYRDSWTNRELFERGAPPPEIARVLRPLIPELDAQSFGHAPLEQADVDQMARLCAQYLDVAA